MKNEKNYWHDADCARAFWDQKNGKPYQRLLQDTVQYAQLTPGACWLDLGCGSGQLTAALWQLSHGTLARILATDCAAINEKAIGQLRQTISPKPTEQQIQFAQVDFSHGLPMLESGTFDGVVSGLAISYAESRDPVTGQYTDTAFMHLLTEIARVLKPSGQLVFSINVPNPGFFRVLLRSLKSGHRIQSAGRVLLNAVRMQLYGRWLKREASRGRFHFYPIEELRSRLQTCGLSVDAYRTSYAGQAYVIRATRGASAHRLVA